MFAVLLAASLNVAQMLSTDPPESILPQATSESVITLGQSYTFEAPGLGDDREVNVWIPPFHDQAENGLNVVYLIDGGQDQDFHHIAGLAQLGALSWQYEPFILVGIQTINRRAELTRPAHDPRFIDEFPDHGRSEAFLSFLTDTVIPFIEGQYNTSDRRLIMGESLAGLFVVDTFLNAPASFTDYVAVSPSLWWDNQAAGRNAAALLGAHDDQARRLYLTLADEGGTMQAGLDQLTQALEASTLDKLDWRFVDRSQAETHSTIFHPAALDAFRQLFALPPYDYGPTPWYMIEGAEPDEPQSSLQD